MLTHHNKFLAVTLQQFPCFLNLLGGDFMSNEYVEGSTQLKKMFWIIRIGCVRGRVRVGGPQPLTVPFNTVPLQGRDQPDP
jgi:hypothetical protein